MFQDCKRRRSKYLRRGWLSAALFALSLPTLSCLAGDQPADCIQPAQPILLAQAAQGDRPQARASENQRPITEPELHSLIRAFETVPVPKGSGAQIRAAIQKTDLKADRADLLVRDVTAVLASIQAKETLATLKQTVGMNPSAREWMEKTLGALPGCVRARFAGRGGDPAYAATADLIMKNRTGVERMQLHMFGLSTGTLPEAKR